jgi:hypothetical protein
MNYSYAGDSMLMSAIFGCRWRLLGSFELSLQAAGGKGPWAEWWLQGYCSVQQMRTGLQKGHRTLENTMLPGLLNLKISLLHRTGDPRD